MVMTFILFPVLFDLDEMQERLFATNGAVSLGNA